MEAAGAIATTVVMMCARMSACCSMVGVVGVRGVGLRWSFARGKGGASDAHNSHKR